MIPDAGALSLGLGKHPMFEHFTQQLGQMPTEPIAEQVM